MKRHLLEKLLELWELVPDLRFGQLMDNMVFCENEERYYFMSDEAIVQEIEEKIQEVRNKQEERKIAKMLEDEVSRDKIIKLLRDNGLI